MEGRAFVATWLRLTRISLVPTIVADGAAGLALAAAAGAGAWRPWALAVSSLALLYAGAMALNDWADASIDARERPERPIPSGRVRRSSVGAGAAALLLASASLALLLPPPARTATLAVLALALLYDLAPSHLGAWGPAALGLLRASSVGVAALAAGAPPARIALCLLPTAGFVAAASALARREADARGTRRAVAAVAAALAALAAAAAPLLVVIEFGPPGRLLLAVSAILALASPLLALRRSLRAPLLGPEEVRRTVALLLSAIPLLDASLAAACGHGEALLLAVAAFGAVRLLVRRIPPT